MSRTLRRALAMQESVNRSLHEKTCVPYWHNWVWMCAPAYGAVWMWRDDRLCWQLASSGFPPPSWSPAFFHIFGWKAAPRWVVDPTGFRATSWVVANNGNELSFRPVLAEGEANRDDGSARVEL